MDEQRHTSFLKRLVANARAIISYQVGLPLGCQKMRTILYWIEPFEVLEYPVFDRYTNATRGLEFMSRERHTEACTRGPRRSISSTLIVAEGHGRR